MLVISVTSGNLCHWNQSCFEFIVCEEFSNGYDGLHPEISFSMATNKHICFDKMFMWTVYKWTVDWKITFKDEKWKTISRPRRNVYTGENFERFSIDLGQKRKENSVNFRKELIQKKCSFKISSFSVFWTKLMWSFIYERYMTVLIPHQHSIVHSQGRTIEQKGPDTTFFLVC